MGAAAINSSKAAFIVRILVESLQHRQDPRVLQIRRLLEAGFTGMRTDKRGVKRYYRDGRQIANPTAAEKKAVTNRGQRAVAKHLRISHDEAKSRISAIGPDTPPEHIKALANDLMNLSYKDLIRIKQDLGARGGWGSKAKMTDRLQQGVTRNELPTATRSGLQAVRVQRSADGKGLEIDPTGQSNRIAWQTPDGKLHSTAIGAYGHLKQNKHLVEPKAAEPEAPKADSQQPPTSNHTPLFDGDTTPRLSDDDVVGNKGWDTFYSGLGTEVVMSRMAQGMKGINGLEYAIYKRPSGKYQLVSRPATKANKPDQPQQSAAAKPELTRAKPRSLVTFGKPITGPSGAKIESYQWQHKTIDDEDKRDGEAAKRVSDWTKAINSVDTGKEIVHHFSVAMPDGSKKIVSLESAIKLLGYQPGDASAAKVRSTAASMRTLAMAQMQLAMTRQAAADNEAIKAKVAQMQPPEMEVQKGMFLGEPNPKHNTYIMGKARIARPVSQLAGVDSKDSEEDIRQHLTDTWRKNQVIALGGDPYDIHKTQAESLQEKVKKLEKTLNASASTGYNQPEPPDEGEKPASPSQPEQGFTGIDAEGREWRNGELVAKQPEEPAKDEPEGAADTDKEENAFDRIEMGKTFKDKEGNEYLIHGKRYGLIQAFPIENGKPVVHSGSAKYFPITAAAKQRYADREHYNFSLNTDDFKGAMANADQPQEPAGETPGSATEPAPTPAAPEAPAEKPKAKRKRKSRAKMTILGIVAKQGGINPQSVKAMANYKEQIVEGGLLHAIRKNGIDIGKMAESLERQGHFRTPPDRHADDYLLELMAKRSYSQLAEEHYNLDKEQEEYYKALEDAQGEHDEREVAAARKRGEEAGREEGENSSVSEVSGWDQPDEEGTDGAEEEDYDRSEPAGQELDTSFDFGANAEEPQEPKQKRAAAGGEIGPNGEFYKGGAFIATTDMPKRLKDKIKKEAGDGTEKVIDPATGNISREKPPSPSLMSISAAMVGTWMGPDGEVNQQYLDYRGGGANLRSQIEDLAQKYRRGEKWAAINEFPEVAKGDHIYRLAAEGLPIAGVLLQRMKPEFQEYFKHLKFDATATTPGFTGIDAQGREWRNGELVAKQEEPAGAKPATDLFGNPLPTNQPKEPETMPGLFGERVPVAPDKPQATPSQPEPMPGTDNPLDRPDAAKKDDTQDMFGLFGPGSRQAAQEESPEDAPTSPAAVADQDQPGDTPRTKAARVSAALDADYENARASAMPNMGADIKGSARHKAMAWKGLKDAEENGTAEALVKRDVLLKQEPPKLSSILKGPNFVSVLTGHLILQSFPKDVHDYEKYTSITVEGNSSPAQLRAQYYEAFTEVKKLVEEQAAAVTDPREMTTKVNRKIQELIAKFRKKDQGNSDRFNPVANSLVNMQNSLLGRGPKSVVGRVRDFGERLENKYGEPSPEMASKAISHVMDVLEGESFNQTFDTVQKGPDRFNAADYYVKYASRKGGRAIDENINAGQKFMMESVGMRGVQWGNTVTDEERRHHLHKSCEAMADLADMTGLPDQAMSLSGQLGLAIGARGIANALAHYEPTEKVINLTRKNGVGSLAHEWAHALDDFIGGGAGNYLSNTAAYSVPGEKSSRIAKAMHKLHWELQKTGYHDRLAAEVRRQFPGSRAKSDYWRGADETFARLFEVHIKNKLEKSGRQNTYLAGVSPGELWPTIQEAEAVAPHMEELMQAIKEEKFSGTTTQATPQEKPKSTSTEPVRQWAQKRFKNPEHAKNFAEWFGDSKAVDKNGEPLAVYHGAEDIGFNEFKLSNKPSEPGIFFTDNSKNADGYHSYGIGGKAGEGSGSYKVYLKMQNPMIVNWEEYAKSQGSTRGKNYNPSSMARLFSDAKNNGHDGIIIKGIYDSGYFGKGDPISDNYVVFDPNQIKSATGNRGTFDPNSPKITEAVMPTDHAAKIKLIQSIIAQTGATPPKPKQAQEAEQDPRVQRIRELLGQRC